MTVQGPQPSRLSMIAHRTALSRGISRSSDAPGVASWSSLRRLFRGYPRLPGALFDIAPNESSHDLGGCRVLLGAQALEVSLLARINEDRQSSGTVFESHGRPLGCDRVR